jgi:RNA polymerase primary sigma factor
MVGLRSRIPGNSSSPTSARRTCRSHSFSGRTVGADWRRFETGRDDLPIIFGGIVAASSRSAGSWKSERELVSAAARHERAALDDLVELFTPHISSVARVYRNNAAVGRTELMQDGIVGLLRALERYDGSRGTPFWPYAAWWVRQAMQQLVAEMTREVVLSDRALRRLSRIRDARALWLRREKREPTVRELADVCGCGREDIQRLLAAELPPRGLAESSGGVDGMGEPLGDRLADETSGDAYDAVDGRARVSDLRARCDDLSDRERHVLYAHFGLDGPARTLRHIAGDLSLSIERIRQIEDGALGKLRDGLGTDVVPRRGQTPVFRVVDPGHSPSTFRSALTRELAADGCREAVARDLALATHEMTAGVWRRGHAPRYVAVGRADADFVCEVSDPAAGAGTRIATALVARLTFRVERFASAGARTFRLWGAADARPRV